MLLVNDGHISVASIAAEISRFMCRIAAEREYHR